MQGRRIAIATILSGLLLLVDAVLAVATAESLGGAGFYGPGLASITSATLGFALVDTGVRSWDTEDGIDRVGVLKLGLTGIFWGFVRVGGGAGAIVPAIVGMTWVVSQAALFKEADEDEDEAPSEASPASPPAEG